jgi:hypothetical protein
LRILNDSLEIIVGRSLRLSHWDFDLGIGLPSSLWNSWLILIIVRGISLSVIVGKSCTFMKFIWGR